eukprot:scaffold164774_cov32-Tisochrysis_lutea.AAC.1
MKHEGRQVSCSHGGHGEDSGSISLGFGLNYPLVMAQRMDILAALEDRFGQSACLIRVGIIELE